MKIHCSTLVFYSFERHNRKVLSCAIRLEGVDKQWILLFHLSNLLPMPIDSWHLMTLLILTHAWNNLLFLRKIYFKFILQVSFSEPDGEWLWGQVRGWSGANHWHSHFHVACRSCVSSSPCIHFNCCTWGACRSGLSSCTWTKLSVPFLMWRDLHPCKSISYSKDRSSDFSKSKSNLALPRAACSFLYAT